MTVTKSSTGLLQKNDIEIELKDKGEITSFKVCATAPEKMKDESLQSEQAGSVDGVPIAKVVTSIPAAVPSTVNAVRKNGLHENENNDNQNTAAAQAEIQEEDDNMGNLLARWVELQSTSAPSADMLSSTLIMLQLQKLEKRVQQQENSIATLSSNMTQQQSSIQGDLTRILSYVAVSASSAQNNAQQLLVSPSNGYTGAVPNATGSHVSGLSNESQSTSTSYHRPKSTIHGQEVMVAPPPPSHTSRQNSLNNIHPSSVFTSVRTLERQPPKPPKRHDSFRSMGQSLGRKSAGMSTGDLSHSSAAGSEPQQGISSAMSLTEQPTSVLSPSKSFTPKVSLTSKSYSKSSFRSAPQLDVIWDASDHTSGQRSPREIHTKGPLLHTNNNNGGQNSKNSTPSKNPILRFSKAKRAAPKLAASLDDGDDTDDDDKSAKIFGAQYNADLNRSYSDPLNASGLPSLVNHDSILTGVQSFMDDTLHSTADDEVDQCEGSAEKSKERNVPATISEIHVSGDEDDHSTICSSTRSGGVGEDPKKEKKKKSDKLLKMRRKDKKEKKDKKKDARGNKIMNNKVGPSSDGKQHKKRHRFSTTKIFWKRSSRTLSVNGSQASPNSPTMPQRQASVATALKPNSQEFSVLNDNPRTHLMPTPSTMDLGPMSPSAFEKKPVQRKNTDLTNTKLSNTGTSTTADAEETMTVKTPMTAKTPATNRTPMTAKTPIDAIQKTSGFMDAPPPPTQEKRYRPDLHPPSLRPGHKNAPNDSHPPSPPPRRRAPFPRTRGMMPTMMNSKREIVVGDSIKQISTLTLDTALPSADAGSVLQEVTHQTITDKCKERGTYTGTVNENEEPDGYGTMIYNSGAFYKGNWKEGHWHGNGILRTPNGDSYEGDFVYDCRHGRGIYKYENGDVYEGDFSSDKRHGKGTFLFQQGSMYRGDFAYGNFEGYGWYEFDEGYYEGSWADGVYEGIGSLIYKDGSHYTGRFRGGAADGMGEEKKADGTSKRGLWRNGEFIGQNPGYHSDQHNNNPQGNVLSA